MFLQKSPIAAVGAATISVRLPQPGAFQPVVAAAKTPAVAQEHRARQRANQSRYQAQCRRAMGF